MFTQALAVALIVLVAVHIVSLVPGVSLDASGRAILALAAVGAVVINLHQGHTYVFVLAVIFLANFFVHLVEVLDVVVDVCKTSVVTRARARR